MHVKHIRTAYKEYPGSNNGQIVATGAGRQASHRYDQTLNSDENYRAAAQKLADRLGVTLGEWDIKRGNDAGTIRYFKVKEA